MATNRVLIVDDDHQFRDFLISLLGENFTLSTAGTKTEALKQLSTQKFALCLADFRLPDGNAHDLVRQMQRQGIQTPVVIVTGYADKMMAIESIELGVSALLEKPFDGEKLHSSIRRVLQKSLSVVDMKLDQYQRCMFCGPEKILLTDIEYRILEILMRSKNRQVSREHLQEEIWGQSLISKHTLDTHIYNLKKKSDRLKKAVRVVHGIGFIFDAN